MMFVVRVLRTARHIRGAEIKRIMALAVDQWKRERRCSLK